MSLSKKDYESFGSSSINLSQADRKRIERMRGDINIVSTVCPDYPSVDGRYTFDGELGTGVSLTANEHLKHVPIFIQALLATKVNVSWKILVADLPETTQNQKECYERAAGSMHEYLRRCAGSVTAISRLLGNLDLPSNTVSVETFSTFYNNFGLPYLHHQQTTTKRILERTLLDTDFRCKFSSFMVSRAALASSFRGRPLSNEELREAAAHGMSMYATHGTLLRAIHRNKNLIVINHTTPNLRNFFMCELVDGYEYLSNDPKFPVGILDQAWY